jgi:hypothetical protein
LLEAVIAFFRVILPPAQRVTDRKTIDEGESSSSAALESFPNERSEIGSERRARTTAHGQQCIRCLRNFTEPE